MDHTVVGWTLEVEGQNWSLNGKEIKDSKSVLDFSFICICNTSLFDFSLKKEKKHLCLVFLFHGYWKGTIVDT